MTRRLRLALAGFLGLLAAGCAVFDAGTYTIGRYGTVAGVMVTLRCRDTYEVFDRPDARTMLVVTNVLTEAAVFCLDSGQPPLAERQRQVARIFLEEKTNRPLCKIVGETPLTIAHREFSYDCPIDAAAQAAPKTPPATRR